MCLLIFIRISAATLRGRQTKLCNFTEILKAQKLKISRCASSNEIFYYFAPLGFGIAEYNDLPIIEKKFGGGGGSVPENGRKSGKMKSIVPDLSEKIMACMVMIRKARRPTCTISTIFIQLVAWFTDTSEIPFQVFTFPIHTHPAQHTLIYVWREVKNRIS